SLANNILAVYQAVFIALAAAVSSRLAQALGEGVSEGIGGTASESVKFTVFIGLLLGIFSVLAGPIVLTSLGAESEVVQAGGL
ncbi:MATE family efflux transporter, partial [Streptococcus suis]